MTRSKNFLFETVSYAWRFLVKGQLGISLEFRNPGLEWGFTRIRQPGLGLGFNSNSNPGFWGWRQPEPGSPGLGLGFNPNPNPGVLLS